MKQIFWPRAAVLAVSAITLFAACGLAQAQSTPAKKELVARIIRLQAPVREQMMRQMAQGPVGPMAQQVGQILQFRVPPEKREALTKEIQGYIGKYVDETMVVLHEREAKVTATVVAPMLEAKFSEDELKQIVNALESPVQRRFMETTGEGLKALSTQLVADTRATVEPRFKAMEQSVSKRLNEVVAPAAAPGAPGGAPAAPAAPVAPAAK